jgi:hypothetical protein
MRSAKTVPRVVNGRVRYSTIRYGIVNKIALPTVSIVAIKIHSFMATGN